MANIVDLAKLDLDKKNLIESIPKIFHFIKENTHISIADLSDRVQTNITTLDAWKKKKGIA